MHTPKKRSISEILNQALLDWPGEVEVIGDEQAKFLKGLQTETAKEIFAPLLGTSLIIFFLIGLALNWPFMSWVQDWRFVGVFAGQAAGLIAVIVASPIAYGLVRKRRSDYAKSLAGLDDSEEFVLLLRSFEADTDQKSVLGTSTLESTLVKTLDSRLPVIAIDNVYQPGVSAGAIRLRTTHRVWQEVVERLSRNATAVVLDGKVLTEGLAFELEHHLNQSSGLCRRFLVSRFDRVQIKAAPIDDPLPEDHSYLNLRDLLIENDLSIETGPLLENVIVWDGTVVVPNSNDQWLRTVVDFCKRANREAFSK